MKTLPIVRGEVKSRFSPEDAERILAAFETLELPILDDRGNERYRARVHLAVVKYSNGNLDRFEIALREARSDWRDVLVMAGLANADWPEVLRESGYGVPPE